MSEIKAFQFNKSNLPSIKAFHFGNNWPVVYLLHNSEEIYVGESINLHSRTKQHLDNPERRKLKNMLVVSDAEFNKSGSLDIESMLIQHIVADEKFIVQNGNKGLSGHNYFEKEKYQAKFKMLWEKLRSMSLVNKELIQIRNSQIFKLSPYKNLTEDQLEIFEQIKKIFTTKNEASIVVNGGPGTGKTILASYMIKNLLEDDNFKHLKIGFVVPMTPIRGSLKKVFSKIKGLRARMVISPAEVVNGQYDLLVVDEAHRLSRRVNITNFASYDQANKKLELDKEATQLDWIIKSSRYQIFFYDKNQSVRPSDIRPEDFSNIDEVTFELKKQIRVKGGEKYIDFIANLFDLEPSESNFEEYEFKIFSDVGEMVSEIKKKNLEYGLSRVVSGYAWTWKTKKGGEYDIEIGDVKLKWNSTTIDWVNSKNSINEVGCIHTVQGYDLNYVGVIIGTEIDYDPKTHKIIINKEEYKDFNGKRSITDPEELKLYILNIYKTLLTRGIHGTYVYVVNENLRNYIKAAVSDTNFT